MDKQIVKADWNPPINLGSKDTSILVVDDDHTSLAVIGGILRSRKYNVGTVRNGGEALSILGTKTYKKPDLVMTDIHMLDMKGFELLKRISMDYQVPIVMMSSDDSERTMTKGLECGAAYFMRKPVRPDDLQDLLLYAIPQKNKESSSSQIVIANTNNTLRSHGNINIQQDAGSSAHFAQTVSQRTLPITRYMHPTISPVEKYYDKVRRRRNISNWNQKPKVTSSVVPPNYPASLFANRKQKVSWSTGLHNKFLDALKIIGLDRAVPKKILEVMNVSGLTRHNVASHLQKYRIFLKRVADLTERADGMSKTFRSKFASSYLPLHFGSNPENLEVADENHLRKKLKQELRAMRDPLSMGSSRREFGTMLPNNNAVTSTIPFTSNYSGYPLELNKQMLREGLVEFDGTSGNNNFMVWSGSIKEIMRQGQAAPESHNNDMTSYNASGNNTNVNSQMIPDQHLSAFIPYGAKMSSSELQTSGLVNNIVPQGTNNFGQGYGMELPNSAMMMPQATFGNNAIRQNALSQSLELPKVNNNEVGHGNMYGMSNNLDISGFQADFNEYLIQQLGGVGDQTSYSLEEAGSNVGNPFLALGDYSAQIQMQNKNQESESIPNQQSDEGSNLIHSTTREGLYFGEDFKQWFDYETIQTQAGDQNANMFIADELYAMYQGFHGNAVGSSDMASSKKRGGSKE